MRERDRERGVVSCCVILCFFTPIFDFFLEIFLALVNFGANINVILMCNFAFYLV